MRGWSRRAVVAAAGVLLLAACSQGGNESTLEISGTTAASPSGSATSGDTEPSEPSEGSGRPKTKDDGPPKVVETVATGLAAPWGVDFLPNGDSVVTERDSTRVLLLRGPDHEVVEVGTIDSAAPQGEAGLLGVAVSPTFDRDRLLYLYVSTSTDNRVVTVTLDDARLGVPQPILTGIPNGFTHDGGRLEFGPDGYLYVSTGESGEPALAQDRESLAGKILRIRLDGRPAPGNPFDTAVWSWGHRNVQGLAFTDDERLWASEFGQDTFDELNLIRAGDNYGWPEVEGRSDSRAGGFVDPQLTWNTDEASPSGLAATDGRLWMAALGGERLWRIDIDGRRASNPTPFFVGAYGRMRTIVVAPDGNLWVTTSNRDGRGEPRAGDDQILVVRP